jgi:uncharacterized protein
MIIARSPELGRVKTRLAADLGESGALSVYKELLSVVARVAQEWQGPVGLLATGSDENWAGTGLENWPRRQQEGAGLGPRIWQALNWGLDLAPSTIAIGTDCPALSLLNLKLLVEGFKKGHVVFGPAEDGGYWAVGVNHRKPTAIIGDENLPWSQSELLKMTHVLLKKNGFEATEGPCLSDCDTLDDYKKACAMGYLSTHKFH